MASDEQASDVGTNLPTHGELVASLQTSISEVFESMFISIAPAASEAVDETDEDSTEGLSVEVLVDFTGALNGAVVLRWTCQGAEHIARGLLMIEEGEVVPLDEVKDALGECGNMVTGSLKSKVLDPLAEFRMGLPVVRDAVAPELRFEEGSLAYRLTRGFMTAELWVEGRPRSETWPS